MLRGCTDQCSSVLSCGSEPLAAPAALVMLLGQQRWATSQDGSCATIGSKDHVAVLQALPLSASVLGAREPASHCQQFVDRPLVVGVSAIIGGFKFSVGADEEFCGQSQNAVGRRGR